MRAGRGAGLYNASRLVRLLQNCGCHVKPRGATGEGFDSPVPMPLDLLRTTLARPRHPEPSIAKHRQWPRIRPNGGKSQGRQERSADDADLNFKICVFLRNLWRSCFLVVVEFAACLSRHPITTSRAGTMVNYQFRLSRVFLLASALVALGGCQSEPPIVQQSTDVERLTDATRSLWARRLPDSAIPSLARLHDLDDLDFTAGCAVEDALITDDGLAKLSTLKLPKLTTVSLGSCDNITDAGVAHLAKMNTVTTVILRADPHITDEGLSHLTKMQNVTYLDLMGCPGLTDRGIERLAAKTNWTNINLSGCPHVTEASVARLRTKLPKAKIEFDQKTWEINRCVREGEKAK